MFESKDFVEYFTEIEMIERNMRDLYAEISKSILDPEIRKTFESLSEAEQRHKELVDELRRFAISKSME